MLSGMLKCVVQQEKAMMGNRLFYCSGISEWTRVFLKVTGRMQVVLRRELCFQIHVATLGPLTPPSGWSEQIWHRHVGTWGDPKRTNDFLSRFNARAPIADFMTERDKEKEWSRKGERGGERGGQGQRKKKKRGRRIGRAAGRRWWKEGAREGGWRLLVKESRIHLKVNRNSLAPFTGTSVTLGGGAFHRGQRANVNARAATHFIC